MNDVIGRARLENRPSTEPLSDEELRQRALRVRAARFARKEPPNRGITRKRAYELLSDLADANDQEDVQLEEVLPRTS